MDGRGKKLYLYFDAVMEEIEMNMNLLNEREKTMVRMQVRYFYKENNIHGIAVTSKRILWINTYENKSNIIYYVPLINEYRRTVAVKRDRRMRT